jgi:hypothetical protein
MLSTDMSSSLNGVAKAVTKIQDATQTKILGIGGANLHLEAGIFQDLVNWVGYA